MIKQNKGCHSPERGFYTLLMLGILLFFYACNEDDFTSTSFSIGDELVESSTSIICLDTLSVELSTVILDSVKTSGTERLLVGSYTDGEFGTIQSKGYFQLTPETTSLLEDDTYDSLMLVLNYDGYSYGDTLIEQTIKVYALTEDLEVNSDGYLYNNSSFEYSKELLGEFTYAPKPSDDYIEIRLSDVLGEEFFSEMVNGDADFSSETDFLDYFPGLVVEAESNGNSSIIGFSAIDSNLYMSLHYHQTGTEMIDMEAKFTLYSSSNQFNQVSVDRSGTVLESWTEQRQSIDGSLTNGQVFVQGITGVLTRVEFPTLDVLLEFGDQATLLKAELIFEPIKNTYSEIGISSKTVMYQTDGINRLYDAIYEEDGTTVQYGDVVEDDLFNENTTITFDLSDYFKSDFEDNYYDSDYGYLLGLYETNYVKTCDRLILGGSGNAYYKPKLKVYYMLYDK